MKIQYTVKTTQFEDHYRVEIGKNEEERKALLAVA